MGLAETLRGKALAPMEWQWNAPRLTTQTLTRFTPTPFAVHAMGLLACLGVAKV
jgi:hypothetical protein